MSRVDRVFVFVLIAVIFFCFYMNGKWWFFVAGICTSIAVGITIGFWLQGMTHKKNESEWNTFLDSLDEDKEAIKSNQAEKSTDIEENIDNS